VGLKLLLEVGCLAAPCGSDAGASPLPVASGPGEPCG
jgi:hypothetical protein